MDNLDNKKRKKKYICIFCNYETNNRTDYARHCERPKHKENKNYEMMIEKLQNLKNRKKNATSFTCECGKNYKYNSGLSKHKLNCKLYTENNNSTETETKIVNNNSTEIKIVNNYNEKNKKEKKDKKDKKDKNNNDIDYKSLVFKLLEENKEFKDILIKQQGQIGELIPKIGSNNNTVNTVNNVKQKLNVNIFLNEKCKDALNINDFVKNIEINLEHLDFTKNNGLIEGLSNAIIENMSKLSLYERPLHCTDLKRETLYIKDNDSWEKDDNKTKIKKAIKDVSKKQFNSIQKWTEENPDFVDDDNKQEYFAKVLSVLGKDPSTIDDKVIKKLCSNVNLKKLLDK